MNTKNNQNEINVGADTGKIHLDIDIRPLAIHVTVTNDEKGIKQAINKIKPDMPTRIIIEATGRLEQAFILHCAEAKLPFVVANPVPIKRLAGALGQQAKTDKLEAKRIAFDGEAITPPLSTLKPESMRLMSDLLSRRRPLITMQTREKNRLQIMPKSISGTIKPILTAIRNQINKVAQNRLKLMATCDEYKTKHDLIQSLPGVANVVAFNLISDLPEVYQEGEL